MRTAYALIGVAWLIIIAGVAYIYNHPSISKELPMESTLSLTSPAFQNNASIPSRFTCDDNRLLSPPLSISGMPVEAKSLALIMDDPDVPKALKPDGVFDHWVLFNMPPTTSEILEGVSEGTLGVNGAGKNQYTGPCPPPQYEPSEHRYVFRLYALDIELPLKIGASKAEVLAAMRGHILAQSELMGRYKRR